MRQLFVFQIKITIRLQKNIPQKYSKAKKIFNLHINIIQQTWSTMLGNKRLIKYMFLKYFNRKQLAAIQNQPYPGHRI